MPIVSDPPPQKKYQIYNTPKKSNIKYLGTPRSTPPPPYSLMDQLYLYL